MKKISIIISALAILVACGGNESDNKKEKEKAAEPAKADPNDITQHPDYQAGLAIEAKSDCITCHRVNEKLTGPAYKDIAAKYAGSDTAVDYLANKIIHGGSGVWGNVQMLPHPALTQEEAKTLARYVLLMNK